MQKKNPGEILFDYSFILTEWHISIVASSITEFCKEELRNENESDTLDKSIELIFNSIYSTLGEARCNIKIIKKNDLNISVHIDTENDYFINIKDNFFGNINNIQINKYFDLDFNSQSKDITIVYNRLKTVFFRKKNFYKYFVSSTILKGLPLIVLLIVSTVFYINKINLNYLFIFIPGGILFLLFALDTIFINRFLVFSNNINNTKDQSLSEKLDLLYSIFLAKQRNSSTFAKWNDYVKTLKSVQLNLYNKNIEIVSLIKNQIISLNKCKDYIQEVFGKNTQDIDVINSTNDKLTNSNKSISDLIQSISSNVDKEISTSKDTIEKMRDTSKVLTRTIDVANILYKNSDYIVLFMKTIEEISSRIHVLSISASITAARSGESGKPFMVVAKEVRKLSEEVRVSLIEMKNKSDLLRTSIIEVMELVNNVNNEIQHSYNEITLTIEKIEGLYLSLNVIEKRATSNIKESTNLIGLLSKNILDDKEVYMKLLGNLSIDEFRSVSEYINLLNEELEHIDIKSREVFKK